MKQVTTFVGIDAHKQELFVAMLIGAAPTPVTWQLANETGALRRLVRKLERAAPGPVRVFYEAGPCGYALHSRQSNGSMEGETPPVWVPTAPGLRTLRGSLATTRFGTAGNTALLTAPQNGERALD